MSHVVYTGSDQVHLDTSGAETASGDGEQQVSGQGQEENGDVLSIGAMSRTQSAELQDGGDEERQGRRRSNSGALARIIKRYYSTWHVVELASSGYTCWAIPNIFASYPTLTGCAVACRSDRCQHPLLESWQRQSGKNTLHIA